ncbi:MAG: CHAT domain-containing protein [Blastocatellia bacterium]
MGEQILKGKAVKEATWVRYLLGNLSEQKKRELEELYFADDDLYKELQVAERELIDRYVFEELSKAERKRFKSYFLVAESRRQKTRVAMELKQRFSTSTKAPVTTGYPAWVRAIFTRPLPAALCLILAIGLGVVIVWIIRSQSDVHKGMAALKEAYQNERPLEARLSEFGYAAESKTRGGQENTDHLKQQLAERYLLEAVFDSPSSESHHGLGVFYLTEKQFDKALNEFQEALSAGRATAQLHNDFGIALLEIGKRYQANQQPDKSIESFSESLAHFSKALELNDSFLEALFNRALCHRYLHLLQQAQDDWQSYIDKDPTSPWADEARQHIESIKEERKNISRSKEDIFQDFLDAYTAKDDEKAWKAIIQSSDRAGNYIITKLLDAYVNSSPQSGDSEIEMLSFAGRQVNKKVGDRFALDLAAFYKRASPKQLELLATARASMKLAHELLNVPKYEAAYQSFKDARIVFDQVGDECEAGVARYWLAICDLQLNRFEQSFALFSELVESCKQANYKWLQVRALNGLANHQFTLNEYSKALNYSFQSQQVAEQIQDIYGLVFALLQLIEEHRYLGNYRQSLKYIQRLSALAGSNPFEAHQVWVYYSVIAGTLSSLDFQVAAIDFQKAASDMALKLGEISMVCVSYLHLGVMQAKLQKFDEALKIARQSYEFASNHANEVVGTRMMAYSSLQIGNICRQAGKIDEAIANYNESIELYNRLQDPTFVYQAHKGMLLSYFASGDIQSAKEELGITLDLDKNYRSKILEESNRNSFFDMEQDVFDLAIDFEHSTIKDDQKAYEYSEESRARSLLDAINTKTRIEDKKPNSELTFSPGPADSALRFLAETQAQMPDKVQILQYGVLKDKLLMWVISKEEFKSLESNIGSNELSELVKNYLRSLTIKHSSELEEASQMAKRLYDILISPAGASLKKDKSLCIVPDKILNYVPFNALVSPASGEYLIKDYPVMTSPSSNVFLACCDAARRKEHESGGRLLAIGNQYFDRNEYSRLDDLPSAVEEAKAVGGFYTGKDSHVLIDTRASIAEITSEMEKANVLHFASHTVIDEINPMKSRLLLSRRAKTTGNSYGTDGVLQASEIYEMNLAPAQLVVLSACQTGIESFYRGEGAVSLARPFIAEGVPLVVASLWSVDSDATAKLMTSFHKHRKQDGLSTIEALHQAQLDMLSGSVERYHHPYYWASFNLIGGYAEF